MRFESIARPSAVLLESVDHPNPIPEAANYPPFQANTIGRIIVRRTKCWARCPQGVLSIVDVEVPNAIPTPRHSIDCGFWTLRDVNA